jgi:tripartite-type tricarboxylate transporter receptor subunit TctC
VRIIGKRTMHRLVRMLLGCLVIIATTVHAQYPSKPIRLIVPFGPGGYTDIVARMLSPRLQELLGQPIVVENRAGSGGNLGAEVVAKAPADGYTLMMAAPPVVINPSLYRQLNYDPKALLPVAMLGDFPNVLIVGPASTVRNLRDLVEQARVQPGKLNYASSGAGTSTHLIAELLKMTTKTAIVHIPYRTAPAALIATMTGEADFYFSNLTTVAGHLRAGKLRAIALTGKKRSPLFAEVPTVAEAGMPELELSAFLGLMSASGTPLPVVARLEAAMQSILNEPDVIAAIERQGGIVQYMGSRAFGEFLGAETRRWADAVKFSGATAD